MMPATKPQTLHKRAASRVCRLVAAGAALLAITGCRHEPPPSYVMADPAVRHPIVVTNEPYTINVRLPRSKDGLSERQRTKIDNFLLAYRKSGKHVLFMATPSPYDRNGLAEHAIMEVHDLIAEQGIPQSELRVRHRGRSRFARRHITLTYNRDIAISPPCGSWPTNLANDRENIPYANFGCSQQNNLAAAVANPRDFVELRHMTPRSNGHRSTAIGKYESGKPPVSKVDSQQRLKREQ